ncbi:MAG: NAD(P)H-dependent oxidoreductase, partial [Eubacteriales bacterium]
INGAIFDCRGCSYKTCSHFARQNSCFYGGVITNDVYPAISECDALLLLCPNYNDSVSANILAFINRLTSVLVYNSLYDKYLFAVIVSGYSGSDIIAQQVLGALCLNKTFMLPPRFCIMQTANDPGEAMKAEGMTARIEEFSQNILLALRGG